jgi:zinc D-Ala-D-Ala dipeptidase
VKRCGIAEPNRVAATLLHLVAAAGVSFASACTPASLPAPALAGPPQPLAGASSAPFECPAEVPRDALVDLRSLDPSLVDLRYATADNFTGAPLPGYDVRRALLRPEAARSLARIQARLRAEGLGLMVWDAYRPVRATRAIVEWAERTGNEWVLEQGYVARRSGHNLGNTVDLTLIRLDTGKALDLGTEFDEFSEAAHTANATGQVLANRQRLVSALENAGWRNYFREWWHFTLPGDFEALDIPIGCF